MVFEMPSPASLLDRWSTLGREIVLSNLPFTLRGHTGSHEEEGGSAPTATSPEPVLAIAKVADEHLCHRARVISRRGLRYVPSRANGFTWGSCKNADFDSPGLEWSLSFFISIKFSSGADHGQPKGHARSGQVAGRAFALLL